MTSSISYPGTQPATSQDEQTTAALVDVWCWQIRNGYSAEAVVADIQRWCAG